MRGILSDRFLRRFAGDLKHRRGLSNSTGEGQNPEAGVGAVQGPEVFRPEAGRSDRPASEKDREETTTEPATATSATTDAIDAPNKAEPNELNETGPAKE